MTYLSEENAREDKELKPLDKIAWEWIRAHGKDWAHDELHKCDLTTTPDGALYTRQCGCYGVQDKYVRALSLVAYKLATDHHGPARFDNFEPIHQPVAWGAVCEFRKKYHCGLIMCGKTGTGKSHIAKAIVREGFERKLMGDFIQAPELSVLFSRSHGFDDGADDAREQIKALAKLQVLVIDDLGSQTGKNTDLWQGELQAFLDSFKGILIITTNYNVTTDQGRDDIVKDVGAKAASRISGRCMAIEFQGGAGKDYRIANKPQWTGAS